MGFRKLLVGFPKILQNSLFNIYLLLFLFYSGTIAVCHALKIESPYFELSKEIYPVLFAVVGVLFIVKQIDDAAKYATFFEVQNSIALDMYEIYKLTSAMFKKDPIPFNKLSTYDLLEHWSTIDDDIAEHKLRIQSILDDLYGAARTDPGIPCIVRHNNELKNDIESKVIKFERRVKIAKGAIKVDGDLNYEEVPRQMSFCNNSQVLEKYLVLIEIFDTLAKAQRYEDVNAGIKLNLEVMSDSNEELLASSPYSHVRKFVNNNKWCDKGVFVNEINSLKEIIGTYAGKMKYPELLVTVLGKSPRFMKEIVDVHDEDMANAECLFHATIIAKYNNYAIASVNKVSFCATPHKNPYYFDEIKYSAFNDINSEERLTDEEQEASDCAGVGIDNYGILPRDDYDLDSYQTKSLVSDEIVSRLSELYGESFNKFSDFSWYCDIPEHSLNGRNILVKNRSADGSRSVSNLNIDDEIYGPIDDVAQYNDALPDRMAFPRFPFEIDVDRYLEEDQPERMQELYFQKDIKARLSGVWIAQAKNWRLGPAPTGVESLD